ncbi:hypothetical protein N1937_20350 [Rhizobium sp. WSM4643]|uniref:T4SS efffector SepA family protein n=1 Tax=Rhizobium sp. WSM4643 TaxID=3138253 RepID=UPI0021A5D155|nr:hypothetical protein [Rhizobium leguminosarum]UWM75011.1 hypothetical protein N1937_20350 [Rhizobium leguminosarum bv. viciae]
MKIELTDETFSRLQAIAKPLVDTPETVILRLLEGYVDSPKASPGGYRLYDPQNPPSLFHTTVLSATLNGMPLRSAEAFWNNILVAMIKELAVRKKTPADIRAIVQANTVTGEKTANGYKWIKEAGISLQGLDANNAWKNIAFVAMTTGQTVEVKFRWQDKEGLENANKVGMFAIPPVAKQGD